MTKTIMRAYDDFASAKDTVRELEGNGLSASHIGLMASNADGWHRSDTGSANSSYGKDREYAIARGTADGASWGAILGGAAGTAAGLGMIAIPGIGPVVAAGWLAALVAGEVGGGVAGGLIGALVEAGISKENVQLHAEALRRGGAIVTARVSDEDEARYAAIMDRRAYDVAERGKTWRNEGWSGYDPNARVFTPDEVRHERGTHHRH